MTIDLEKFKADSDWQHAFCQAFRGRCGPNGDTEARGPINFVTEVLFAEAGDNDGPDWIAIVRLNDGRFAKVFAGCDYTGWD